jgi:hypothetical protein
MAVMAAMTRTRDFRVHFVACDASCRRMAQPASVPQELANVQQGVVRRPAREHLCRPDMSRCIPGREKPALGKSKGVRAVSDIMFALVSAARDKSWDDAPFLLSPLLWPSTTTTLHPLSLSRRAI